MKATFKSNKTWTPAEVDYWEQTRAKGKARYILSLTIPFATRWFVLFTGLHILHYGLQKALSGVFLLLTALVALGVSFLFAYSDWVTSEESYHKALLPEEKRATFNYAVYDARNRIAGWEKTKAKGLARYILTRGCAVSVVIFGFKIAAHIMQGDGLGYESLSVFASNLAFCGSIGVVSACSYWYIGEDFYRKALETESKRAEIENTGGVAKV